MSDSDELGEVIHYYDKIGVAVIRLKKSLKTGDNIKFVHGEIVFEQTTDSMQIEHEQVDKAKKGQEVAIKVGQEVKKGTKIYAV